MITLVLGGARSGKSAVAEARATESAREAPVTYIATALDRGDADFAARIAAHQARRPRAWRTVEAGAGLVEALASVTDGVVLVDSLGTWLAAADRGEAAIDDLVRALIASACSIVVVSEEVGMGVHPSSELGRHFRDSLGRLNQAVAAVADEVVLVVAGRVLPLERP
jgi:adenosyl cobinamide kinase/adenosyl cobinamide phosphate guanylyltransferase